MIPRLPPLLLALLGGASIYGIKHVLDRLEPKVLGPPGSNEYYEKKYRLRRNVKKVGMATALTSVAFAGYYVYTSRQHRTTPAAIQYSGETQKHINGEAFYEDQYRERDRLYAEERALSKEKEREREQKAKDHLEKEKQAMEQLILGTNQSGDR